MSAIPSVPPSTKVMDVILIPSGDPPNADMHVVTIVNPQAQMFVAVNVKTGVPKILLPVEPVDLVPMANGVQVLIFMGLGAIGLDALKGAISAATGEEKEILEEQLINLETAIEEEESKPPPQVLKSDDLTLHPAPTRVVIPSPGQPSAGFVLEIVGQPERTQDLQRKVEEVIAASERQLTQEEIFKMAEDILESGNF